MLDKLTFSSSTPITYDQGYERLQGQFTRVTRTSTRYHSEVFAFHRGQKRPDDHVLTLHTEPKMANISPTKVELNPTRFANFQAVKSIVASLRLRDLELSRLDHAVDIEVPLERIHESLIISRKKFCAEYGQGHSLTGWYLGRFPEVIAIYDRGQKLKQEPGKVTRVEIRQHREKLPIQTFDQLPQLLGYAPFAKLRFASVDSSDVSRTGTYLRSAIQRHGAQRAFKNLNQHSNFQRRFGSYFSRPADIPDLDEMYGSNLKAFFEVPHAI